MKKLSHNKGSALQSIIIGLLLLIIGCIIIVFVAEDTIKSFLRHYKEMDNPQVQQQQPTNTTTQTYGNAEPQPQTLPAQPTEIERFDTVAPNGNITFERSTANLSEVHGAGSKSHLVKVPSELTSKNELVHRDVYSPMMSMIEAARNDGIKITIVSAYRSYDHQRSIWERKWGNAAENDVAKAKNILRYSSFPGTSRHHWGTDIDFNSVSPDYWNGKEGQRIYQWLKANAPKYGFCQTYGDGRGGRGYENEAWHWSHIPTANQYYQQISNNQVLNVALSQNIRGAKAVQSIASELMGYITAISPCSVSHGNYPAPKAQSSESPLPKKPIPANQNP